MIYMKEHEFRQIHNTFLRAHPEKYTPWFMKVPRSGRFVGFLSDIRPLTWTRVLDICGGYGEYATYMHAVEGRRFEYTCLDINQHRIKWGPPYLESFNMKGNFILHDIENPLPVPAKEFDMVWLFGWCDPPFDCHKLFTEVHRVLDDNGTFMFNMAYALHYKTKYSEKPLRKLMKETNFNVLNLKKTSAADYGIVARKCRK